MNPPKRRRRKKRVTEKKKKLKKKKQSFTSDGTEVTMPVALSILTVSIGNM